MTADDIFRKLFNEFAAPIRTTHSLIDYCKSADFKGSKVLRISYCKATISKNMGVGVRLPSERLEKAPFLVFVCEAEEGGLEAHPTRLIEGHPDKHLIDAFLARAEDLEKELTVESKQ